MEEAREQARARVDTQTMRAREIWAEGGLVRTYLSLSALTVCAGSSTGALCWQETSESQTRMIVQTGSRERPRLPSSPAAFSTSATRYSAGEQQEDPLGLRTAAPRSGTTLLPSPVAEDHPRLAVGELPPTVSSSPSRPLQTVNADSLLPPRACRKHSETRPKLPSQEKLLQRPRLFGNGRFLSCLVPSTASALERPIHVNWTVGREAVLYNACTSISCSTPSRSPGPAGARRPSSIFGHPPLCPRSGSQR